MPGAANRSNNTADLRRQAETCLPERQAGRVPPRNDADTQRLLHELEVHQIELEMQNAELQRARVDVDAALEKITDLYDFAPVGYLTLDREGGIREANLAGAGLLGVARSGLAKRHFVPFVAPAARPAFDDFLKRVFSSQSRERCEVSLRVEGKPPIEVELEAVVTESGRACRLALTDITELKRAAADRLILSKLESTGVLAGGIAHDFNNLLSAIALSLDLAWTLTPVDGELARCLKNAEEAALVAGGLTQRLLTFSRGGALTRTATSLPGLIRESVEPVLDGSMVSCDFFLAEDLWPVTVDKGQIDQVMRNLILNAREAMPEGGVISVRAENVAQLTREMPALPPGKYVRLTVADRGVGISAENLPKIFDPYFSTKQRGNQKGMGLGLTICHMIIQRHGGAIAVKSVAGEGTSFDIYLPVGSKSDRERDESVLRDNPGRRALP
jgi:signal transduction histidine kinase